MLSKRTTIGFIIGIAIITLGGYSLIIHMVPTIDVEEHFFVQVGELTTLTIPAPENSPQSMTIIGSTFDFRTSKSWRWITKFQKLPTKINSP